MPQSSEIIVSHRHETPRVAAYRCVSTERELLGNSIISGHFVLY
jgi:hypothetical protein